MYRSSIIFAVISLCLLIPAVRINAGKSPRPTLQKGEDAEYVRIEYKGFEESEGKEYQQFFPHLREGEGWYWTRMKGIGNVDNTPEKEEVVLITVQEHTNWDYRQAFLLVCTRKNEAIEKKYLLEIFNNEKEEFIEGQSPPYVFQQRDIIHRWYPNHADFKLVDLNKDGILDVFVRLWFSGGSAAPFYVVAVSFQDGNLKKVFSSFAVMRDYPAQYLDIDKDGVYEILIPNEITVGFEHAADPIWISCYEWNGKRYRINNQKFYSKDTDILISFLQLYSYRLRWYSDRLWGGLKTEMYFEGYEFYLGLIYYYRRNLDSARYYLERIVDKAKNENYVREARAILKSLASEMGHSDFAPQPPSE
ncbi:MAG: tol-pal system YbgF family protein [Candidatus Poribacteria bacterium]